MLLGIPTIICHTYKKLCKHVYRVYIIGLRYRHDCDQFKYGIYVNRPYLY